MGRASSSLRLVMAAGSHALEIGALGDRQALQVAAQAVEAEIDGAEAHPVAPVMRKKEAITPPAFLPCESPRHKFLASSLNMSTPQPSIERQ
jgi:hypothetical protein